ncbi:prepilin-type N-terminal cleavage/methylation domain-containing protein [Oceanithermus sp.]|uniref:PilW family protein n=1 Tax=Oceanithermus sp. TaxID=2268145 RepID=UPI0025F6491B|nr:prepilin-type N-terminal cleavage/methylation domain-containing protein [Oceanithermus sp.]
MRGAAGFTLVEVAVAGLVAGVVALMAAMLFVPAARIWTEAQTSLELASDAAEVRRALTGDVQQARSVRSYDDRLLLRLTDGTWACYRFEAGRLERAGSARAGCRGAEYTPLTVLDGYAGRFERLDGAVRLRYTQAPDGGTLPEVFVALRLSVPAR